MNLGWTIVSCRKPPGENAQRCLRRLGHANGSAWGRRAFEQREWFGHANGSAGAKKKPRNTGEIVSLREQIDDLRKMLVGKEGTLRFAEAREYCERDEHGLFDPFMS